ncbi:hypothetical protein EDEG_05100, partial [Edhazardia aedis USNM 41457]
ISKKICCIGNTARFRRFLLIFDKKDTEYWEENCQINPLITANTINTNSFCCIYINKKQIGVTNNTLIYESTNHLHTSEKKINTRFVLSISILSIFVALDNTI